GERRALALEGHRQERFGLQLVTCDRFARIPAVLGDEVPERGGRVRGRELPRELVVRTGRQWCRRPVLRRIVQLRELLVAARAESAVGGTGLRKALRALDALRFVLNGAALGHSALAAVQLPARRILGVAVCGCGAGQRERC